MKSNDVFVWDGFTNRGLTFLMSNVAHGETL